MKVTRICAGVYDIAGYRVTYFDPGKGAAYGAAWTVVHPDDPFGADAYPTLWQAKAAIAATLSK